MIHLKAKEKYHESIKGTRNRKINKIAKQINKQTKIFRYALWGFI